jgi:D-alanine-D-alanine ligase
LLLHGAVGPEAPPEDQDTLVQAGEIISALQRSGYKGVHCGTTLDFQALIDRISTIRPRLIFNLVESLQGRDSLIHLVPALLDELGVPYTGASQAAIYLTTNKLLSKRLLTLHGVPTPSWWEPDNASGDDPVAGPWIVKSVSEHASLGMDDSALADTEDKLRRALSARRMRYGGQWFAESYVEGREFNISVLGTENGPWVLPLAEIVFENFPEHKPRIVGSRAKWEPESFEYRHTVRRFLEKQEPGLTDLLTTLSLRCWELFDVEGYARVDFRVDEAGQPWVLEVNVNPSLAPDAGFAAAGGQAGIGYDELITRIVQDAMRRGHKTPARALI